MSVSLSKGQKVSLTKGNGASLTNIRLGLGWDEVESASHKRGLFSKMRSPGGAIDLDASAICLDSSGAVLDIVYYGKTRGASGSISHSGDNLTGAGDGDDESIIVDLAHIPDSVTSVVFVITSYRGHTFDRVRNAFCRVLDQSSGREEEVARYNLSEVDGAYTAQFVAALKRDGQSWSFLAIGEPTHGKVAQDLSTNAARYV